MSGTGHGKDPGLERDGVMGAEYAAGRESSPSLRYRLKRRAGEVLRLIDAHRDSRGIRCLLDVGTADGRMLDIFARALPGARMFGVEYSTDLAVHARSRGHVVVRADASDLPMRSACVDAVVGCAVIEHLRQPLRLLQEAKRVLRPGGLIVLTTPSPFWEHLATAVGHLQDEQHHFSLDLHDLTQMLRGTAFEVLASDKFMLSPVGMPLERSLEAALKQARLHFMMANQIVIARRPDR
jgi:SAM-dependent methyltransferase